MLHALIPIKGLDGAKTRLADVLDGAARRDLVVAMYRDVLGAATACRAVDHVSIVTSDLEARAIAEASDASTIDDAGGLNESLSAAATTLAAKGDDRLLVVFADLPLANPEAIERVATASAHIALVRSGDGGTNALALAPDAIEFQYGPESAAKHIAAAEAKGLSVVALDEPSLQVDIDTRDDLERLANGTGVGAHTLEALRKIRADASMTTRS